MNQEVTDFIESIEAPWQQELCGRLRGMVHEAVPDIAERMQYRKPHFLKNGKYAAVITTAKQHVSFTIFNAAGLDLPADRFEGPPERKTVKIADGQDVDFELLCSSLQQAAAAL